ncbi:FAD dependent monooxygenase [Microdochium nivale]|nr:FAD dependent monooxygenase [Microdochium nivale]
MEKPISTGKVHSHQVVIIGGGITGLTSALMLERLGVDYVLLEAYGSVTPNVGASIALMAHGLRIMDQLGCYEDIKRVSASSSQNVFRDGSNGGSRISMLQPGAEMLERHGYSLFVTSRYDFVSVLHNHVQHKERLLVNRKVVRIESDVDPSSTSDSPARVHTADGDVFEAQVVIGADGVHSFVRSEMWRLADEATAAGAAAIIPAVDREPKPVEHGCVFGVSKPVPGIGPGDAVTICYDRFGSGILGAPSGDVFYFWYWSLPDGQNRRTLDNLPRFTEDDKKRELARNHDTIVADCGSTVSQVFDGTLASGATAVPHFTLTKWHAGRIFILGDAAHKFNPQAGQGGNSCVESCAALVNALQEHVLPAAGRDWPLAALNRAFVQAQTERVERVTKIVNESQDVIRSIVWASPESKIKHLAVMPHIPNDLAADSVSAWIKPAIRLYGDKFPNPPAREHKVLYDDEQPGFRAPAIAAA